MLESITEPEQQAEQITIVEPCTAHLQRAKTFVGAYRLGLCKACFEGRPIFQRETFGEDSPEPTKARKSAVTRNDSMADIQIREPLNQEEEEDDDDDDEGYE